MSKKKSILFIAIALVLGIIIGAAAVQGLSYDRNTGTFRAYKGDWSYAWGGVVGSSNMNITIGDVNITSVDDDNGAFSGGIVGPSSMNITIADANITTVDDNSGAFSGGIVGPSSGDTTITDVNVISDDEGSPASSGGIVGPSKAD